jgi:hypothetical protein
MERFWSLQGSVFDLSMRGRKAGHRARPTWDGLRLGVIRPSIFLLIHPQRSVPSAVQVPCSG